MPLSVEAVYRTCRGDDRKEPRALALFRTGIVPLVVICSQTRRRWSDREALVFTGPCGFRPGYGCSLSASLFVQGGCLERV